MGSPSGGEHVTRLAMEDTAPQILVINDRSFRLTFAMPRDICPLLSLDGFHDALEVLVGRGEPRAFLLDDLEVQAHLDKLERLTPPHRLQQLAAAPLPRRELEAHPRLAERSTSAVL